MVAVIIGLLAFFVLLIVSKTIDKDDYEGEIKLLSSLKYVGLALVVIGVIWMSACIVPAGHRGVCLRLGAVNRVFNEGLNFKTPFVETLQLMEVRTLKETTEASAASKDMQMVNTTIQTNYHINPNDVGNLYKQVGTGYRATIIDPIIQESVKQVSAQYTAEQLIAKRAELKFKVETEISQRLAKYNIIVEPNGVSITNFSFSEEFNKAIEAKQVAQQDAEKQKYVLQKAELERQTLVAKAKGEAESVRIKAIALKAGGGSKVLAREWIEKWNGVLPLVSSGSAMMIDVRALMNTTSAEKSQE